jgi:hypothetical protein
MKKQIQKMVIYITKLFKLNIIIIEGINQDNVINVTTNSNDYFVLLIYKYIVALINAVSITPRDCEQKQLEESPKAQEVAPISKRIKSQREVLNG